MPGTSSLSPADQQPFRVEVAGDEGRVWLEDLAGLTDLGVDWDYDDRSWRVSVREYTDSGASGGSMTSGSSFGPTSSGNDYDLKLMGTGPVVETWSTWDGDEPWVSPFGKEVHVTVTVTAESDGNFCWHYLGGVSRSPFYSPLFFPHGSDPWPLQAIHGIRGVLLAILAASAVWHPDPASSMRRILFGHLAGPTEMTPAGRR